MRFRRSTVLAMLAVLPLACRGSAPAQRGHHGPAQHQDRPSHGGYYGFDKNGYPGDNLLSPPHSTFAYAGYWLSNPPGMQTNPWAGKRAAIRAAGFGFLLLFNGRLDAQLQHGEAAALGREDAASAIAAAKREGFPDGAVIF